MIRIVEARKAAVTVGADQEVVLEFVDADLKAIVGPQGAYQPITGVLKASGTGVISNITKMVCRRKESPDQGPVLVFKLTNGLTLAEFNDMIDHDTVGLSLPKYPVLGGYEIVLTLDLGTATSDISLVTKGENQAQEDVRGLPLSVLPFLPFSRTTVIQPSVDRTLAQGQSIRVPAVQGAVMN